MPKAFTAKGMNMLPTLLKSELAIQRSVKITRAFTAVPRRPQKSQKEKMSHGCRTAL